MSACLSEWYPRLVESGVRTPKTAIIETDLPLIKVLDGGTPDGWSEFVRELEGAGRAIGYPVFLRTGHGSAKHGWRNTCYVPDASVVAARVASLVEWSFTVDIVGLPVNVWAVRELVPLVSSFRAFRGRLPISLEARVFIDSGEVQCVHPYWPKDAIEDADLEGWRDVLDNHYTEIEVRRPVLEALGRRVGRVFGGAWSVDFALDAEDHDWWALDMAPAARSFHWEECEHAESV